MTDETPKEPMKAKPKREDKDIAAIDKARAEALKLAAAEGVTVDKDWPLERIEAAVMGAMQAKEDAKKKAEAEAAKPPVPAPSLAGENPAERAEVMKQAHEIGMDLEDLKGRPLEQVLSMIGKFITEQKMKAARPQSETGRVTLRVLKKGDNKISKGIHVPGVGDLCFKAGDHIPNMPIETARQHEANGYGEILE